MILLYSNCTQTVLETDYQLLIFKLNSPKCLVFNLSVHAQSSKNLFKLEYFKNYFFNTQFSISLMIWSNWIEIKKKIFNLDMIIFLERRCFFSKNSVSFRKMFGWKCWMKSIFVFEKYNLFLSFNQLICLKN